jgi:hypothetical protein
MPVAIRIDLDDNATALHHTSRVDYSKLYTIEHNIKVKPFGMVNREHIRPLMEQFRAVFLADTGGKGPELQQLRTPASDPMVDSKQTPNASKPANTGNKAPITSAQRDGVNRHGLNRGGGGPPGNDPPGRSGGGPSDRPGSPHMQASNVGTAAMDPRAVLRRLGFTETEVDAIINRISQRQNQREAIAAAARARALSEGYSENIANRVANLVSVLCMCHIPMRCYRCARPFNKPIPGALPITIPPTLPTTTMMMMMMMTRKKPMMMIATTAARERPLHDTKTIETIRPQVHSKRTVPSKQSSSKTVCLLAMQRLADGCWAS